MSESQLTPTSENVPTPAVEPAVPESKPVLPGPDTAPSKAQFLAALHNSERPSPSSLHTSTFSVADESDGVSEVDSIRPGTEDGHNSGPEGSADRARASPVRGPISPGFHGRMRRHIYGLSVDGFNSPEGSTLALPYGTSRSNSVETFATYDSDDIKALQSGHDSDQSMLEDPR